MQQRRAERVLTNIAQRFNPSSTHEGGCNGDTRFMAYPLFSLPALETGKTVYERTSLATKLATPFEVRGSGPIHQHDTKCNHR
jgi:hypothetical protein